MSTSVTNGVAATGTSATTTTDRGMNALTTDDFFKLLVTELKQQDPLEPAKTADMVNEVSQIRGIELSKNLTDTLQALSGRQQMTGVSDLLGKYVVASVKDSDGKAQEVTGVVTGVRFESDGSAVLELDGGQTVAAKDITRITTPDAAAAVKAATSAVVNPASAGTTATTANGVKTSAQKPVIDLFPWLDSNLAISL